jgi:hypothetical protein
MRQVPDENRSHLAHKFSLECEILMTVYLGPGFFGVGTLSVVLLQACHFIQYH